MKHHEQIRTCENMLAINFNLLLLKSCFSSKVDNKLGVGGVLVVFIVLLTLPGRCSVEMTTATSVASTVLNISRAFDSGT